MEDTVYAHTADTWDKLLEIKHTQSCKVPMFVLFVQNICVNIDTFFILLHCLLSLLPTLSTPRIYCKHLRLRSKDSVEDTLPPVIVFQQEDILDNGGQAGFREGTIQTSFQERRPFPLQRPLAAHIPLNTETGRSVMCNCADSPLNSNKQTSVRQGV